MCMYCSFVYIWLYIYFHKDFRTHCRPRPATTGDVTSATSGDSQAATSTSDEYLASIHQRVTDDAIARKVSCNHQTITTVLA